MIPSVDFKCDSIFNFFDTYSYWLSVSVSLFVIIYYNLSWISDTEMDASGNWTLWFHVGADILNWFFLCEFFIFSMYIKY